MVYQQDSFTDVAYTTLETHAGELNCAWQRPTTSAVPNQMLISPSGTCFRSGYNPSSGQGSAFGSEHFTTGYTVPVADYVVECQWIDNGPAVTGSGFAFDTPLASDPHLTGVVWVNGRAINNTGLDNCAAMTSRITPILYGRVQADFSCYQALYNVATTTWQINKRGTLAGSWPSTTIVSATATYTPGGTHTTQLVMRGSQIQIWNDGALVCSATDATVLGAGFVGIRTDGVSSPIAGYHLDGFKVHDGFPGLGASGLGSTIFIPGIGIEAQ